jgi:PIN domain nuclease of toxin-antitoxin system
MRYLIDTNIIIFLRTDTSLISKDVSRILENPEHRIYISSVSLQEIFVLLQNNKIIVPKWKCPEDVFDTIEKEYKIEVKYVKKEHLLTFAKLEQVKDHNDPFDRMIIAQAITENVPLISSDAKLKYYYRQKLDFIFNNK